MSEYPVIDLGAIESLRALTPGDNDEFLRELVGIYIEDTLLRIVELEQSLAAGDRAKFERAAHSIKGSSANLGAQAVRYAAEALEARARVDGLSDMTGSIDLIKTEFRRAQQAFAELLPPG